ncbi:MAG: zinc ribbon domain-containing protein [bacterium]|nr:zinc ribbon domain-containing protein [bacterium]
MAFFDDLGKKLSLAGQSAVQKTKEVADLAKWNSYIYDEEKKINNNYLEIGKLYVSLHADGHETEYDGMIAAIRESEEKIREYRQQITDIKGTVACPKCGAQVAVNAVFCSSCGASMTEEEGVDLSGETEQGSAAESEAEATVEETEEI